MHFLVYSNKLYMINSDDNTLAEDHLLSAQLQTSFTHKAHYLPPLAFNYPILDNIIACIVIVSLWFICRNHACIANPCYSHHQSCSDAIETLILASRYL
jgi:hypothetical protein